MVAVAVAPAAWRVNSSGRCATTAAIRGQTTRRYGQVACRLFPPRATVLLPTVALTHATPFSHLSLPRDTCTYTYLTSSLPPYVCRDAQVQESLAFFKKAEKLLGRRKLLIDCCGSHGLLGCLFVAFGRASEALVLDLHQPGSFEQLCAAWAPWLARRAGAAPLVPLLATAGDSGAELLPTEGSLAAPSPADLNPPVAVAAAAASAAVASAAVASAAASCAVSFETGDFHKTLPAALDAFLAGGGASADVCVVACHACTHLTDRIVDLCIARGVDFAVMPCCQRDLLTQNQLAIAAKGMRISEGEAIDLARLGGICARGYDCRWRTIDKKITPVNRLLVGLSKVKQSVALQRQLVTANSEAKMTLIYSRLLGGGSRTAPLV